MCVGMFMAFSPNEVQAAVNWTDVPASIGTDLRYKIDNMGVLYIAPSEGKTDGYLANYNDYASIPWYGNNSVKRLLLEENVHTGTKCSGLFSSLSNCTEMDLSGLDISAATGHVSNVSELLQTQITLIYQNFDTSNVTNMSYVFSGCFDLNFT